MESTPIRDSDTVLRATTYLLDAVLGVVMHKYK